MRIVTSFVLALSGTIGIAGCNPDVASAQDQQVRPIITQEVKPIKLAAARQQNIHIIEIHKMKFQTKSLHVKVGDTVTWINKDLVPHTATAKDKSWDSGRLKNGEKFSLTITDQTSLEYFCFYHRQMKAELVLTTAQ